MAPPQRTPRERKKPELFVPDLGPSSGPPEGTGRARGRGRPKGRGKGRGRGRGGSALGAKNSSPTSDEATATGPATALPEDAALIGQRLTVRWDQEEEDFEGYVRQLRSGDQFPYEVAYDDGDEEWGWFSTKHFNTDEHKRAFSWLTDQDKAVQAAADKAWQALEESQPATANAQPEAFSPAPAEPSLAPSLSLAARKEHLRAQQQKVQPDSKAASEAAPSDQLGKVLPATNQSSAVAKPSAEDAVQLQPQPQPIDNHMPNDAGKPASVRPAMTAAAAARLQLASGQQHGPSTSPSKKRKAEAQPDTPLNAQSQDQPEHQPESDLIAGSSQQIPLDAPQRSNLAEVPVVVPSDQRPGTDSISIEPNLATGNESSAPDSNAVLLSPDDMPLSGANGSARSEDKLKAQQVDAQSVGQKPALTAQRQAKQKANSEKRVKHAHDHNANSKPDLAPGTEPKRRRLQKVSEMRAGSKKLQHGQQDVVTDMQDAGQTTEPALVKDEAATAAPKAKQEAATADDQADHEARQQQRRDSHSKASPSSAVHTKGPARASSTSHPPPRPSAAPTSSPAADTAARKSSIGKTSAGKPAGLAAILGDTQPTASPAVKSAAASAVGSKAAPSLQGSKSIPLPPFALPGAAAHAKPLSRLSSQTGSLTGAASTSTRISMPPGLTQLSSLRSKAAVPEGSATASPAAADITDEEAAATAAAAAATAEAHLKTVMQSFEGLLQSTLQRTKESVHKVTQFAVKAAAGKQGKTAAHRLVIMVLDLIETAPMSKRVDLFYLLDSLLQVSLRESKDGTEAKLEAAKIFSRVIAAGLHRIASAMAKDSECITKASKVLDLWQRRQILSKPVLKPALQLLEKSKSDVEAAVSAAAAIAAPGLGPQAVLQRPMRLVMPSALPDSITGLPTMSVTLPIDQWGSLAGFRFCGADGQVTEFQLKPDWAFPLANEPEDWDVNPATEDLPLEDVLREAAVVRADHLKELQRHKEAKYDREVSPWAQRSSAFQDEAQEGGASPASQQDADMEGASPDQGATGYYATGQDSAFQFEPPRAPAHYGASRNSPGPADQYSGFHSGWGASAGSVYPWQSGTLGSSWGSVNPAHLQPSQTMYDPFLQTHPPSLHHPRLHSLAQDQLYPSAHSMSPEAEGTWYKVPFDEASKPASTGQTPVHAAQHHHHQQSGSATHQPSQPQVAVRDSNVDFDDDNMNWSDDDVAPPLPAESPPLPDGAPPLPSEEPPPPLPPMPPEEDRPPLPQDDTAAPPLPDAQAADEPRLATAGLFEPFVRLPPGPTPPPPLPPSGYGFY